MIILKHVENTQLENEMMFFIFCFNFACFWSLYEEFLLVFILTVKYVCCLFDLLYSSPCIRQESEVLEMAMAAITGPLACVVSRKAVIHRSV